jgi:hypothetical protein
MQAIYEKKLFSTDDSTLEEIQYHLYVLQKIQSGLQEVGQGNVKSQEEVENRMKKWLSK